MESRRYHDHQNVLLISTDSTVNTSSGLEKRLNLRALKVLLVVLQPLDMANSPPTLFIVFILS